MKKVLIITYYWVPSGGAGVQRWVKFTKYLRSFGWEPVIYTPQNPEYPALDPSLEKDVPSDVEVVKTPIWEPYNIYRNLMGKKNEPINAGFISENKKSGWKERFFIWIRGNFFIPDPRRFWVKPSVEFLKKYISENQIDAIVTTGPPQSMHLIGAGLKKFFPTLPWLADFRDPWTNIDFYEDLHLTKIADRIHHRLEKKVVTTADVVIVVSKSMKEDFLRLQPKRIEIIPNGYDEDDFSFIKPELDEKFTISHIGTLKAVCNPTKLWKVMEEIADMDASFKADLRIQLIGKVDFMVVEDIQLHNLNDNLVKISYVPHDEAIKKEISSQVLLLLISQTDKSKGIISGKFYEYLAAHRPILGIGPTDGDVSELLKNTQTGIMIDFDDEKLMKKTLLQLYEQYKRKSLTISAESMEKFSRKNLTHDLANLLDSICKK
jgi:glycosyltransferase involved in cell wall biosynthesis